MTGIDISKYQPVIPPGNWEFVIARVTHDAGGVDPLGPQHFRNALTRAPVRGVYHFWDPTVSSGAAQARLMANTALSIGFRKDVDLFALDSEAKALGGTSANAAWVREFFVTAHALLGARALWYVGWPFYVEHFAADTALLREQAWWLPSYGPNDGQPHDPKCPYPPALHQYTSVGGANGSGLDVSRVMDTAAWHNLIGAAPAPKPTPAPKVARVIDSKFPPVDSKAVYHPGLKRWVSICLALDGGVFAPQGGFCGTPIGHDYWKGHVASALAVKGDSQHPLTDAEVNAGKLYAVIASNSNRYAYGPGDETK